MGAPWGRGRCLRRGARGTAPGGGHSPAGHPQGARGPKGSRGLGMAAGLGQAEVVLGTAWVLGGCGVRLKQGAPRGKVGWSLFCTCVPTSALGDFFIRFLLVLF